MRIFLFLLTTLLSCQSFGQVQQYKLDNGLKILVKEDHRAPVVISMIWYNVGSADEPGGITGTSHALEHLMFKGTAKYPLGVFSKKIAGIGGEANAFTNNDYTAFFEKIAAPQLALSFELEADRMHNLSFDKDAFDKEMKVIQEERRMRTDNVPQALTFERFLATAHLTAPYNHPVIGWMSYLKQMQVEDAKAWYERFYAPNNATLVVVGDVDPANVYALAKTYFGDLRSSPQTKRRPEPEPPQLGLKTVQVHSKAQVPMIMLGYLVPTVKTAKADLALDPYALEVLSSILAAGDNGRLSTDLIRNRHIASSIDVFYNLYSRYQTQFVLYGTPSQSHSVADLRRGLLAEIKRLQTTLVSEKELQRIKTQIIAQKTFERDSIFSQAMEIGLLETIGIGWQVSEKYVERINSITALQLQQTAQRYFQDTHLTEAQLVINQSVHK